MTKEVDAWLTKYDNPMKPLVKRLREIILAADDRIDETIKWQTPTFAYKGNLASFQPRAGHIALDVPTPSDYIGIIRSCHD